MRRTVIGSVLAFLGTIWALVVIWFTANNWVTNWHTPPGLFLTTVWETGMMAPFVLAVLLLLIGLVILGIEYFRKDQ